MKTTYDKFIENLSPEEKKQFEEEHQLLVNQISKSFNHYLAKRFTPEELHEIMLQVMEEHDVISNVDHERPDFKTFKKKAMQDEKFKSEYESLCSSYEIEDFQICPQCNLKQRFEWRDLCYDCRPALHNSKNDANNE